MALRDGQALGFFVMIIGNNDLDIGN